MSARKIKRIYIHHTATPRVTTTFEWVDNFHKEKGWGGIGYHYFIDAGGTLKQGRPDKEVGAHVKWDNQESIGICLAGNFEEETPTDAQIKTLTQLLQKLCHQYNIKPTAIWGHRDRTRTRWWRPGVWLYRTLCPGKTLYEKLPILRKKITASI